MSNEEIQEAVARAEAEYEMLKDKVHDQYDEIQRLKQENERLLKKSYKDDVIITKAIDVLDTLKGSARWERHLYEVYYLLDLLKGDDKDV